MMTARIFLSSLLICHTIGAAGDQGEEINSFIQVTAVEKSSSVMSAIFITSRGVLLKAQNAAKTNVSSRETLFRHGSQNGMPIREASRTFGVPRGTLKDRLHLRVSEGPRKMDVIEDGKPILRGGIEMQPSQESTDGEAESREPSWVAELRSRIRKLVNRYGRKAADKKIQRAVHDIERARNVLMDVKGDSDINYKYILREDEDAGVRLPDPLWLIDFKRYLRNLITKYGRVSLDEYVTPVVMAIEKANNVRINDIDGEIVVDYTTRIAFGHRVKPHQGKWTAIDEKEDAHWESATEILQL